MRIDFKNVTTEFVLRDNHKLVQIGEKPKWLSQIDAFIGKVDDRSLEIAVARPTKRHITIMNAQNQPVVSLVFFKKILTINTRFEIDDKGQVSFNCNAKNAIVEQVVCRIQTYNIEDVFNMRIIWYGHKVYFDVKPVIGPVLIDPIEPVKIKKEPSTEVNVNVTVFDREKESSSVNVAGSTHEGGAPVHKSLKLRINLSDLNPNGISQELNVLQPKPNPNQSTTNPK